MNKNDICEFVITDLTDTGNGIGRKDNMVVFVPQTAVGDTVRAKIIKVNKNYCIGKLIEIINPSQSRIDSDCDCFSKCGGCAFRHITYESEIDIKQSRVEECIRRIAKIDMKPQKAVCDKRVLRYRNKAQFPVNEVGEVGFFATHSHRIIPTPDCLLHPEIFNDITSAFKDWMRENAVTNYNSETNSGIVRHLYIRSSDMQKEIMVVIVANADCLPHTDDLISKLHSKVGDNLKSVFLNINKKNSNVILGKENKLLFGEKYITDTICGITVRLSPNSFYQVNRDMAELLYKKVKEYACPAGKTVIDLYCGTGTIGLTMASQAKSLIGVEIVDEAVANARQNAKDNGILNAEFICGDAFAAAEELAQKSVNPDVVILDPPRKGCDEELLKIVSNDFSPERIVYVSCNPATLARDIAVLNNFGYKLVEYTPFDLFPRTAHIETVCLLSRQ